MIDQLCEGVVKAVQFTRGSPFGEQIWTIHVGDAHHTFHMWESFMSPTWANVGDRVEFHLTPDRVCHLAGGSKLILRNCASIDRIVTPAVAGKAD